MAGNTIIPYQTLSAFAPNGVIIVCVINAPGAMNYSLIAEWLYVYGKIRKRFQAFWWSVCGLFLLLEGTVHDFQLNHPRNLLVIVIEMLRKWGILQEATSMRLAAEWGTREFHGAFLRMKYRFVCEERSGRKIMLLSLAVLYNLRARLVEITKVLSTFMPSLNVERGTFFSHLIQIPD